MASFALKLNKFALFRYAKAKTAVLFSRKYLLLTNTGITVSLGCTGDVMQQKYEVICDRQNQWNPFRTKKIFISGLFIGPTCHYWYLLLDRIFPGRKVAVVMKKILIDQIVFSPVNISMFLVIMGYLEGMNGKQILQDMKEKGLTLLKAEWIVWPPAQMINFFFLPTRFRVLYDNTVSLGFDVYYSYVMYRMGKEEKSEDEESEPNVCDTKETTENDKDIIEDLTKNTCNFTDWKSSNFYSENTKLDTIRHELYACSLFSHKLAKALQSRDR